MDIICVSNDYYEKYKENLVENNFNLKKGGFLY